MAVGWTHWGRESLAKHFLMGPRADPDGVCCKWWAQCVTAICAHRLEIWAGPHFCGVGY